jgi:hypothetical protein
MSTTSSKGRPHRRRYSFVREHSLSIASASILVLWICLYSIFGPKSHIGSFFGNAIADWSGVVVMVSATKYLYEKDSTESRRLPRSLLSPLRQRLRDHSLSLFLILNGHRLGCPVCVDGLRGEMGASRRQYRFGMDADHRPRSVDETVHRAPLEGERPIDQRRELDLEDLDAVGSQSVTHDGP